MLQDKSVLQTRHYFPVEGCYNTMSGVWMFVLLEDGGPIDEWVTCSVQCVSGPPPRRLYRSLSNLRFTVLFRRCCLFWLEELDRERNQIDQYVMNLLI